MEGAAQHAWRRRAPPLRWAGRGHEPASCLLRTAEQPLLLQPELPPLAWLGSVLGLGSGLGLGVGVGLGLGLGLTLT